MYCYDLQADVDFLAKDGRVRITPGMSINQGIPVEDLARLYQAADVHLLASWGEGFGLPTLQAAAAGVVPVAVDYAANRELVLDHGEAVPARHFLPGDFGIRAALIDIDATVARLETLYADRAHSPGRARPRRGSRPHTIGETSSRNGTICFAARCRALRPRHQTMPPSAVSVAQSKVGQLPIDPIRMLCPPFRRCQELPCGLDYHDES